MSIRTAHAKWTGTLKEGEGKFSLGSKAWSYHYSFKSRFEDDTSGTNPEELIAAAHASCFAMAFSFALEQAGFPAEFVDADAAVKLDAVQGGFAITQIALSVEAKVPNISEAQFAQIAQDAKNNCPVSKALASVEITLSKTKLIHA